MLTFPRYFENKLNEAMENNDLESLYVVLQAGENYPHKLLMLDALQKVFVLLQQGSITSGKDQQAVKKKINLMQIVRIMRQSEKR